MKVIPLKSGVRHQEIQCELSGRIFGIEVVWFPSVQVFYMSLLDSNENYLVRSIPLRLGVLGVSWSGKKEEYPNGRFALINTSGRIQPDLDNLGQTSYLLYKGDDE